MGSLNTWVRHREAWLRCISLEQSLPLSGAGGRAQPIRTVHPVYENRVEGNPGEGAKRQTEERAEVKEEGQRRGIARLNSDMRWKYKVKNPFNWSINSVYLHGLEGDCSEKSSPVQSFSVERTFPALESVYDYLPMVKALRIHSSCLVWFDTNAIHLMFSCPKIQRLARTPSSQNLISESD